MNTRYKLQARAKPLHGETKKNSLLIESDQRKMSKTHYHRKTLTLQMPSQTLIFAQQIHQQDDQQQIFNKRCDKEELPQNRLQQKLFFNFRLCPFSSSIFLSVIFQIHSYDFCVLCCPRNSTPRNLVKILNPTRCALSGNAQRRGCHMIPTLFV